VELFGALWQLCRYLSYNLFLLTNFAERRPTISKNLRVNERIRVPEVRVIDEMGEQVGILRTRDALNLARQRSLDLVEVAPNSQPPVCRLLDYGKYRYEQTKKERDARKTQKVITVKEIRLEPKIASHDLLVKSRQARSFLEEGNKVKVTVRFRGRELAHTEIGRDLLNQFIEQVKDISVLDQTPKMEGKALTMILARGTQKIERPTRPEKPEVAARPVEAEATARPKSAPETTVPVAEPPSPQASAK
jgi:translation initiation factor IF-3